VNFTRRRRDSERQSRFPPFASGELVVILPANFQQNYGGRIMRKLFLRGIVFAFLASLAFTTAVAQAPKAKRINRGIELLSQGQPIYYTGSHSGTDGSFEQGKKDAQTYADYISYDMEHAPYDIKGLADYMQGLAAGGPTRSGHRTPAVIVNVPVNGVDEAVIDMIK